MTDTPRVYETAKELLPGPVSAALVMLEPLWAPPNIRDMAIAALQDTMVYLRNLMVKLHEQRGAEIAKKVTFEEALELTTQTLANMGRTANHEKRRMMANVVVNGLADADAIARRRHHFVRSIADLEVGHIDLLRDFADLHGTGRELQLDEVQQVMLADLTARKFIGRYAQPAANVYTAMEHQTITDLGRDFLAYVQEPNFD